MKVLITGGAGYLGSALAARLLHQGHQVCALDSLRFGGEGIVPLLPQDHFTFRCGDIRDDADLQDAVAGMDAVIHLAALVGDPACAEDPEETRAINLDGVRRTVEAAQESGVTRFLFASTCSNYGISDTATFADEKAPLNPVSLYAETKVEAEKIVTGAAGKNFSAGCFRLATVFGLSPRMRFDLLINEFVRDAWKEKRIKVYGPDSWRPFLHIQDAADAFARGLAAPAEVLTGEVFNIGSENYQKKDLVALMEESIPGLATDLQPGKKDPRNYKVSFEKMKKVLPFQSRRDARAGIREMIQALDAGVFPDPSAFRYQNVGWTRRAPL